MARRCVFCCNNTAKLTLEDVLPTWYLRSRQGLGLFTHEVWSGTGPLQIRQIPLKIGVKCVCGKCNNGWMGDIQGEALKFMKTMIDGQPTELDLDGQRTVAAWVMMTALTWQFALPSRPISGPGPIPERFIRDFYAMPAPRLPPAGAAVWIGRYLGQLQQATYYVDVVPTIQADDEVANHIDVSRDPLLFGITLCLENFVAQVVGNSIPGVNVTINISAPEKYWLPIWPPTPGSVLWPPQPSIDELTLAVLERAFNPARPSFSPERLKEETPPH